jgi:hypothetical protein
MAQFDGIPPISGAALLATEWLKGAESFNDLTKVPRCCDHLLHSINRFARQYGEWTAFGLVFGIPDRNSGNWVWSIKQRRLSLVDTEYGFQVVGADLFRGLLKDTNYAHVLRHLAATATVTDVFRGGIGEMLQKCQKLLPAITQTLQGEAITATFIPQRLGSNVDQLAAEVLQTV